MIGLVLVMHGELAQAFYAALQHVDGPQEQIECLSIIPSDEVGTRLPDIKRAIDKVNSGEGVVLVTDFYGGTPCRIATAMLDQAQVHVVAGINLPMLIKLARVRRECRLFDVVDKAKAAGQIQYYCETISDPKTMDSDMWIGTPETLSARLVIPNIKGLHARASAKFVKCAETFDADIRVSQGGETVGGTSIMGLLMLGAAKGTTITVTATGREAKLAISALVDLVTAGFDEIETQEE